MGLNDNQIAALYSNSLFAKLASNLPVSLYEFNIITDYLVHIDIPYDVSFVPGTRKEAASLQLTIHVNPSRTEVFVVSLEQGSSVFAPSP